MRPFLRLLGIPDLNGTTLKERSGPLDFIHNSQNSGEQMRLHNHGSEVSVQEGDQRDGHSTEQGPCDPSSRQLEPTATQRCGTDAGGLRHRQEKEDASTEATITSITCI